MAIALFDLVTVKYNIKPKEKVPQRRDGMNAFDLMRARRACSSFQQRRMTDIHGEQLLRYPNRIKTHSTGPIGINVYLGFLDEEEVGADGGIPKYDVSRVKAN